MQQEVQHLDALKDIRQMMKRSSRFISLSGLSGIAAGVWALIGAFIAHQRLNEYYVAYSSEGYTNTSFHALKTSLLILAGAVLAAALVTAFYFTWRRARRNNLPVWDHTSKQLTINLLIPLITGGVVILSLLQNNDWSYVGPLSLIFYGLALVNGSKYTLSDIRYLGICEIILGLINTQFVGYSLYFWAAGFGALHIIYGFIMWWKHERSSQEKEV
jgi:hypothetical protein